MRLLPLRLMMAWIAAFLLIAGMPARADLPPRPDGPIADLAGIIPAAEEAALDQKLRAYNQQTGRALMVVTVPTLDGQDVAEYANALGHTWGVGGKETDQGLILLVAPTERKVRIEVGQGLEQFLPDVLAARIIRDQITPRFRAGDFAGGIAAGIEATIAQLNRDPADARAVAEAAAAAEANRAAGGKQADFASVVFWLVLMLFLLSVFGRRGARGRRYGRGGIDPGIVLWGASEIMRHGGGGGGGGIDWGGFGGGDFGGGGASGDW